MGRRPNPLISEWFHRGPKLNDNSNRYPHTCKACGENFPKGRLDSLTNHLAKKCPAITESQRARICAAVFGLPAPGVIPQHQASNDVAMNQQQNWTALETLAEVSRHFNLSDKPDGSNSQGDVSHVDNPGVSGTGALSLTTSADPAAPIEAAADGMDHDAEAALAAALTAAPSAESIAAYHADRFDLHEQFTVDDNPPENVDGSPQKDKTAQQSPIETKELTAEEKLELLQAVENVTGASENLNMAAAAAARVNQSLVDPQLLADEAQHTGATAAATTSPGPNPADAPITPDGMDLDPVLTLPQSSPTIAAPAQDVELSPQPPSMASMTSKWKNPAFTRGSYPQQTPAESSVQMQVHRGGFRLDSGLNGNRVRHSRSRFDASRRKEVQEVRKIGACIRCRVLRKMCSKGDPCDTCKKVLSPRVWKTGCIRTKLHERLDIYAAGVQVVHSQKNITHLQSTYNLKAEDTIVWATHFPDSGTRIVVKVLEKQPDHNPQGDQEDAASPKPETRVVMLEHEKQDLQVKVEEYVKALVPTLIASETSHFARVTLETAHQVALHTNDDCLKRALELWGYIEVMDRERSWHILEKHADEEPRPITSTDKPYDTICLQLSAAAERKAGATNKALLHTMQRLLQDSKVRIGFPIYLASIILLHCVEKSTWSFMAWDQDNLRPMWPLERPPSDFTSQGHGLASNVQMLLSIRRALPQTVRQEPGGLLFTEEQDPDIQRYFQSLQLNVDNIESRLQQQSFSPTDSRSLELTFCSVLLLPNKDVSSETI